MGALCTLHISGLVPDVDDDAVHTALTAALGDQAPLLSCTVVRDRQTGTSKGFGFIAFAHPEEAAAALSIINGDTPAEELGALGTLVAQIAAQKRPAKAAVAAEKDLPDIRLRKKTGPSKTKHPRSLTCSNQRQQLDPRTGKLPGRK
tara:strand:- start:793 stop:1233 length:441 start_codon:yes stop_codon:yes gene_type:complete